MNIVRLLASAVLGYLLGNIQTGLIVGWTTKKIDLRQHGSGSSGATNALRILGRQSALWTLLGDFLKGLLAACLGLLIGGWRGGCWPGMCVVAGHIWPVFFGFKGGKGVATSLGVLTPAHAPAGAAGRRHRHHADSDHPHRFAEQHGSRRACSSSPAPSPPSSARTGSCWPSACCSRP